MCHVYIAVRVNVPALEGIYSGSWNLLLLLLLSSSSLSLSSSSLLSSSPLCRLFILMFLRQTMSLGNTVLQLFIVTIHGAYIVSFSVETIVLLH